MKNESLLQLPATISKIITMSNRCLRLHIDTQENLADEEISKIVANHDKLGWFTFVAGVEKSIKAEDLLDLPELKDETDQKSPSQRLRAVMYIEWDKKSAPYKTKWPFEVYYRGEMERIIDKRKEALNE